MENVNQRNGKITSVDEEKRVATFIASDTTKDRHRTVVNQRGWQLENFNNNGIVGYQHDVYGAGMCGEKASPDDVIGKGRAYVDGNKLMLDVEFKPEGRSDLADKVWLDVRDGFLKAVSVGFMSVGGGTLIHDETGEEKEFKRAPDHVPEGMTFKYDAQELLEVSVVNIPSNPKALKKSLRDSTANALIFAKKTLGIPFTEIEQMTVRELVDRLENPDAKQPEMEDLLFNQSDLKRLKLINEQLKIKGK